MRRLILWIAGVFIATIASPASAQSPEPASAGASGRDLEGPRVQEIRAVERGFFVESVFGLTVFVNEIDSRRYSAAPTIGAYLGYDLASIFNIGIGARAAAASGPDDPDTPVPRGDLFFVAPMVKLQLALITTERNFFWVVGEAGFGFSLPEQIDGVDFGGSGPMFAGALGYEHFTKLRHFSIGAQAGVLVVTEPAVGIGVSLMPTLKYTF